MSVVRNSAYNLASMVVPVLVAVVTVPLYIHAMGEARYGVIAIVTSLSGYFGVLDFGLSAASAQRIAASDPEDIDARRSIFWTATVINLAMGLISALLLAPVTLLFFANTQEVSTGLMAEIRGSLVWIALALPVLLLGGVLRGALQGAGRFAEMTLINVIMGPVTQIVPLLVALWISPQLGWVLAATYAMRALTLAAYARVIARKVLLGWTPMFDRGRVRDLLSFGGWVTLSALVDPLLTTVDRFIVGARLGMASVSHYTVPYQLAQRSLIVPSALVDAMLPRIAGSTEAEARVLSHRALRAVAAVMTPPMVAGIIFVHPFLDLWISRPFAEAAALPARFLLLGCWFNALGFCCFQHLRARGNPRLIAVAHLLEIPPYLAVLWLAMQHYGLAGAGAAFALRMLADDVLLARFGGLHGELSRLLAMALLPLGLAFWLGQDFTTLSSVFTQAALWPAFWSGLLIAITCGASLLWFRAERHTFLGALRRKPLTTG